MVFALLLGACNDAGFALVSISPIYGWTDGCGSITLSGHGIGSDAAATLGSSDIPELTTPEDADLRGFQVSGVVPAGPKGFASVTLRSGGQESTLEGAAGYYYVECPSAGWVDRATPDVGLTADALVVLEGCGLDTGAVVARLVDAGGVAVSADLPLVSMCGKGTASFTAPALPDGSYFLELVDLASGTVLSGAPCAPADSGDTGSTCSDHPLTYGGAE